MNPRTRRTDQKSDDAKEREPGTPERGAGPIIVPFRRCAARADDAPGGIDDMVFIRDRGGLQRMDRSQIGTLHADGNYVELRAGDKRFILRTSLRDLMAQLGGHLFVQVNRNTAVNVRRIDLVTVDSVEVGGRAITLSRSYRPELLERLHVLSGR